MSRTDCTCLESTTIVGLGGSCVSNNLLTGGKKGETLLVKSSADELGLTCVLRWIGSSVLRLGRLTESRFSRSTVTVPF